jgi:hypothetical protein
MFAVRFVADNEIALSEIEIKKNHSFPTFPSSLGRYVTCVASGKITEPIYPNKFL